MAGSPAGPGMVSDESDLCPCEAHEDELEEEKDEMREKSYISIPLLSSGLETSQGSASGWQRVGYRRLFVGILGLVFLLGFLTNVNLQEMQLQEQQLPQPQQNQQLAQGEQKLRLQEPLPSQQTESKLQIIEVKIEANDEDNEEEEPTTFYISLSTEDDGSDSDGEICNSYIGTPFQLRGAGHQVVELPEFVKRAVEMNSQHILAFKNGFEVETISKDPNSCYYTNALVDVQQECALYLMHNNPGSGVLNHFASSQKQDAWLFHTMFSYFLDLHIQGVYIDVTDSFPRIRSNSFFFDTCLGWKGLVLQSDPVKVGHFQRSIRSCEIEELCFDWTDPPQYKRSALTFTEDEDKTCDPLGLALSKYQVNHVDVFTMDIELEQLNLLQSIDFEEVEIDVMMIRLSHQDEGEDILVIKYLEGKGFILIGIMALDGDKSEADYIFIRKGSVWNQFCTWKKGHATFIDLENHLMNGPNEPIQHPWPENCDLSLIETAMITRRMDLTP